MPDDEIERLRSLFAHAHEPITMGYFQKAMLWVKKAFGPRSPQGKPLPMKSAKVDETAA